MLARGERQSSQTAMRGGAWRMKGGNAVVSSRLSGELLDGLTSVCTAEVADAPQVEVPLVESCQTSTQSQAEWMNKIKRTHADQVIHNQCWWWRRHSRQASVRCGSFPPLKQKREEDFCKFVGQKMVSQTSAVLPYCPPCEHEPFSFLLGIVSVDLPASFQPLRWESLSACLCLFSW